MIHIDKSKGMESNTAYQTTEINSFLSPKGKKHFA